MANLIFILFIGALSLINTQKQYSDDSFVLSECKNIKLYQHHLEATCNSEKKEEVHSMIDLNDCLGIHPNGNEFIREKNYFDYCHDCNLEKGTMSCNCHHNGNPSIELDRIVFYNNEGKLICLSHTLY